MKTIKLLASLCLALFASSCLPEQKVSWSPDGKSAVVFTEAGLRLCDPQGALLGDSLEAELQQWHPNSTSILTVEKRPPSEWDDYASFIEPRRKQNLARLSNELLEQLEKNTLSLDGFGELPETEIILEEMMKLGASSYEEEYLNLQGLEMMTTYLVNEQSNRWNQVAQRPEYKEELADWREEIDPKIYQLKIRPVAAGQFAAATNLVESIDPIRDAAFSPDGQSLLFLVNTPNAPTLYVLALGGTNQTPRQVDTKVGKAAWSPDGRFVVYSKSAHALHEKENQLTLGTIARVEVAQAGELLPEFTPPEDLAAIAFQGNVQPRYLSDGRILFCTATLTLPFSSSENATEVALFTVDPNQSNQVARLDIEDLDRGTFDRLAQFAVSPDRSKVALIGSNGQVAVYQVNEKQLQVLQPDHIDGYGSQAETICHPMIPSWRGNPALCFVVPPGHPAGAAGRAEVVLWEDGTTRSLSRDWPNELVRRFLPELKKPEASTTE